MIKAIINGCNGAMGRVLTEIIGQEPSMEVVAGVDRDTEAKSGYPVYDSLAQCPKADVIIDFSVAKAVDGLISYCEETKIPLVLCTTGLSEDQLLKVNKLSETSAVLRSANMSVGINLLIKVLKEISPVLAAAGFDMRSWKSTTTGSWTRPAERLLPWRTPSTKAFITNIITSTTGRPSGRSGTPRKSGSRRCGAEPSSGSMTLCLQEGTK